MCSIRTSSATTSNENLKESKRKENETNTHWLKRHITKIDKNNISLLLIGGSSLIDFRLRYAQSNLRHDLTPSSWSHIALIPEVNASTIESCDVCEISLNPDKGFGIPTGNNGLQIATIKKYNDVKKYPNIAIASIPLQYREEDISEAIENLKRGRFATNLTELIINWLSYVWGVGKSSNPILEGVGVPSAVMVEFILSSLNFEMTPNTPTQASSPEAIWQALKWWESFYKEMYGRENSTPVKGFYYHPHELVSDLNV